MMVTALSVNRLVLLVLDIKQKFTYWQKRAIEIGQIDSNTAYFLIKCIKYIG